MSFDDATVLVVDDDPIVRRSVARLAQAAGFAVKTFASPIEFLSEPLPKGPACVVLDMCMEGMTGLQVQDALSKNERHIPIVFLSGHGTIPDAAAGFKHGAQDFLEKPFRPKELIAAITRAIEQDRADSAERADREQFQQRYTRLTAREQEVMALVVMGLLNKHAADELGISEKTIKVHRARVMVKMKVKSLAELVRVAEHIELSSATVAMAAEASEEWASGIR